MCAGPKTGLGGKGARGRKMVRVLKVLLVLAVIGFVGLTIYAYLGDLSPNVEQVTRPITLPLD